MKILVACEYSGIVRDAFIAKGHDALSCDLLPTEQPGPHYQGDVRDILFSDDFTFDMMIAFPPCTDLCVSGARYFAAKKADGRQQKSIDFFLLFTQLPIAKIAIENPVGTMSTLYQKPTQIIQPWQFGIGETKKTCLWLKNLPPLMSSVVCTQRRDRIHKLSPSPDRAKIRSKTFQGIADAMANQWG